MSKKPSYEGFVDRTGIVYGRLTVVSYAGRIKREHFWMCDCQCGEKAVVSSQCLRVGYTKSCGCLKIDMNAKSSANGNKKRSGYSTWKNMKSRCYNKNNPGYQDYGGRGIVVCERWRCSFLSFYADMGERPSSKHSIGRIDNNGNYEPGNCRWETVDQQMVNTRTNVYLTFNGKTQCFQEWERETGIRGGLIRYRIHAGWPVEKALTVKPDSGKNNKRRCTITYNGVSAGYSEWAKMVGLSTDSLKQRINKGWTIERALTTPARITCRSHFGGVS